MDHITSRTGGCDNLQDVNPLVPVYSAPFNSPYANNVIDATPYIGLLLLLLVLANVACLIRRRCVRRAQQVQRAVLVRKVKEEEEEDELL